MRTDGRCGRCCCADDGADTGALQCRARRDEGGTGGDHVVDEQYPQRVAPRSRQSARTKRHAVQPLGTVVTGLLLAMAAVQQTATRNAELATDGASQQFGLVVTTSACTCPAGGRPGHDIDRTDAQATDHEMRQLAGDTAAIAELETVQHLAGHAIERKRSEHAIGTDLRGSAGQRKPTAATKRGASLVATGAASGEGKQSKD